MNSAIYGDDERADGTVNRLDGSAISLGWRIKKVMKELGPDASVESSGKSIRTLDRYVSGEVEPPLSVITGLSRRSGYSLRWLATGEGPEKGAIEPAPTGEETIAIPRLDVRASAGGGATGDTGEAVDIIGFPRAWLRSLGVTPANARVLTVTGDSMEPTLSSGDLLLVDISARKIKGAALYVLVIEDDVYVKRAQPRLNGSILITSDNERYPPEEVTAEAAPRLRVAGKVVWFGRSI